MGSGISHWTGLLLSSTRNTIFYITMTFHKQKTPVLVGVTWCHGVGILPHLMPGEFTMSPVARALCLGTHLFGFTLS